MAAGGYPDQYEKGKVISGLDQVITAQVFHAGTKVKEGAIVTDGGRVLAVTGKGASLHEAKSKAYEAVKKIKWDASYHRNDIGSDIQNILAHASKAS
jgi:phosphoribosylamine--glycine ligase